MKRSVWRVVQLSGRKLFFFLDFRDFRGPVVDYEKSCHSQWIEPYPRPRKPYQSEMLFLLKRLTLENRICVFTLPPTQHHKFFRSILWAWFPGFFFLPSLEQTAGITTWPAIFPPFHRFRLPVFNTRKKLFMQLNVVSIFSSHFLKLWSQFLRWI